MRDGQHVDLVGKDKSGGCETRESDKESHESEVPIRSAHRSPS